MAYSIVQGEIEVEVTLRGAVTIRDAQQMATQLREQVAAGAAVRVELGELENIDTCMLQLLCSLRATATAARFENPPEAFVNAVERCGLRREFLKVKEEL